ncbi:TRAP transporter substrate-binding protein [Marivita sp.]|uniref:TRAP transporter substrate-binding protein n=1 Tax=Marivita sp. TaxID=2003365 RepID=UPI003B5293ED
MKLAKSLMAGTAALAMSATASLADSYNWKLQSFWGGGSAPQLVIEQFAANMNAASGGDINITVLPSKAIVAHNQTLQAVGSGILDMHKSTPCYYAGVDAAFGLLCEMNAGYSNAYQFITWYYQGGGIEIAQKVYAEHGLHYIGPVPWGVESIPTKEPIRTVADFEGVKIRMPEGPSSELFASIGAAPVSVHGSEVYTSLEKGVIAATDWSTISINDGAGLHNVAPYAIYPGIHSIPMGDVSMNLETWNSLDAKTQTLLELGVRTLALDMLQTFENADAEVLAAAEEKGITLIDWAPEERAKFRAAAQEIWAATAAKSPLAQEVYDSQIAWLKSIGQID